MPSLPADVHVHDTYANVSGLIVGLLPTLMASAGGIIAGLLFWRRSPKAMALLLLGQGLQIIAVIVPPLVVTIGLQMLTKDPYDNSFFHVVSLANFLVAGLMGVSVLLMVCAAIADRAPRGVRSSTSMEPEAG